MDAAALRRSWREVESLGDEAATTFYSLLFAADPRIRLMFPPGMAEQRDKLLTALGRIVSNVDDTAMLAAFAAQLGRDHRRFGVLAHHYRTVGAVLLETLRRCLGRQWTGQLALDWGAAYDLIARLMVEAAEQDARVNPPGWLADVERVDRRTADIVTFTVRLRHRYDFVAGQSCAVHHPSLPAVWRYLSPANAPRPDNRMEFHVRAIPGGQLSPLLTYMLKPDDVVTIGAPVGTALTSWQRRPNDLVLISSGTGLAPLRAIADQLTQDASWHHSITLVVADAGEDFYDGAALQALQQRSARMRIITARHKHRSSTLKKVLASGPGLAADVYLCGPPSMVTDCVSELGALGVGLNRIHTEAFTSDTYPPSSVRREVTR